MDNVPIEILRASEAHLPQALAILEDSVLGQYFDTPTARSILEEALAQRGLEVALRGPEVVGFSVVRPHGTFEVFPYLHLLAVKTSSRGQGIGSQLLAHLEAQQRAAPGYPFRPKVFLLVAKDNPEAVKFYERHGYRRAAVFDDMFTEGDTEFLMVKDLGPKQ